jgi:hypothetical protein
MAHNTMEFKAPTIESFDETEILGDAPEATGTHGIIQGSQLRPHES